MKRENQGDGASNSRLGRLGVLAAVLMFCVPLAGCTTPGMIVGLTSKTRTNATTDSFVLPKRPRDFVAMVSEVAGSLKYEVSGVDRANNAVSLGSSTSMLTSAIMGPSRRINIEMKLRPDGRTVDVQMMAVGNLSTAKQESVDKRLKELRDAIMARAS